MTITDEEKEILALRESAGSCYLSELLKNELSATGQQRKRQLIDELEANGFIERRDNGARQTPGPFQLTDKAKAQSQRS